MSIVIKGIDMPKDIDELRLIINGMSIAIEPTQAIQIPKNHGKIVDLDDLVVKYWDGNYMEIGNEEYDNAVAILEAEE